MKDFKELSKIVVKISTASGSGSGFYLKNMDIIVTNHHVVSGNKSVAVETQDKDKIKSTVLQINPLLDLAFLKPAKPLGAPDTGFLPLEKLKDRDKVYILGFPFGMPFTVTEGIVSSTKQLVGGLHYIQTDAAINPGNSGGPMMSADGKIIGITTSKFMDAENMGFALPADQIMSELEGLKNNPSVAYSVKCPSCNFLLIEKTEYCDNCGSKLEADVLFSEQKLSPLAVFVEESLQKMGIDPVISRNGVEYWEFYKGSALVRVFIYRTNYLYTTCPMVKLPKANLTELYKFILSDPVKPFSLGIDRGIVYISYRVYLADIDSSHKEEIRKNLINLANKADELDNILIDKYGCEWSEEAKPDDKKK
ncbi:MAG: trypsin-like peptidase domain-containing protein [Spirochaetes bacterium]|nr:trypsin-like peptidase domain-containing protein [Spirochaetota bacterium]